ncbi:sigma factor [Thiogranum longum]|uniref:sigma factor n=1 Tax=Thiogranum longum TaxID=1537524 RepID=UPI00105154E7|nr:sigma factor [Thiogranum longum]
MRRYNPRLFRVARSILRDDDSAQDAIQEAYVSAFVKTRYHRARNLMQEALDQQMDVAGLHVFEFAGKRCDAMVVTVLKRLGADLISSEALKQLH